MSPAHPIVAPGPDVSEIAASILADSAPEPVCPDCGESIRPTLTLGRPLSIETYGPRGLCGVCAFLDDAPGASEQPSDLSAFLASVLIDSTPRPRERRAISVLDSALGYEPDDFDGRAA